jgi:hypothetical protein
MAMEMDTVRPFKIDIPDASLERLHKKLELADFPEEPEAGPDYGATVYVRYVLQANPNTSFYDEGLIFAQIRRKETSSLLEGRF